MAHKKHRPRTVIRQLLDKNILFTVEELAVLSRATEQRVREAVSVLKNPDYCDNPMDLVQLIGLDRQKRWGIRGATECYRGEG